MNGKVTLIVLKNSAWKMGGRRENKLIELIMIETIVLKTVDLYLLKKMLEIEERTNI